MQYLRCPHPDHHTDERYPILDHRLELLSRQHFANPGWLALDEQRFFLLLFAKNSGGNEKSERSEVHRACSVFHLS